MTRSRFVIVKNRIIKQLGGINCKNCGDEIVDGDMCYSKQKGYKTTHYCMHCAFVLNIVGVGDITEFIDGFIKNGIRNGLKKHVKNELVRGMRIAVKEYNKQISGIEYGGIK